VSDVPQDQRAFVTAFLQRRGSFIALDRWRERGHDDGMVSAREETIPTSLAEILRAAEALDLPIDDACLPGVLANLALLSSHAEVMLGDNRPSSR
jgi:hypothetical protein